jgi:hypothetical protein
LLAGTDYSVALIDNQHKKLIKKIDLCKPHKLCSLSKILGVKPHCQNRQKHGKLYRTTAAEKYVKKHYRKDKKSPANFRRLFFRADSIL